MPDQHQQTIGLYEAINAAFRFYYSQKYELACKMCDLIVASHPDIADIVYLNGLALLRLGRQIEGQNHIRQASELAPQIEKLRFLTAPERESREPNAVASLERHLEEVQKFRATRNFILSYPKCGRTWAALVLGAYALNEEKSDPLDLIGITSRQKGFSATEVSHDDVPRLTGLYRPSPDKSVYRGKKVAFLVRDPRDVVVSHYFQHAKRTRFWNFQDTTYQGTMSDFIHSEEGSVENVVSFYNVWARQTDVPATDFLLVRYEDLVADPIAHFRRFIEFFGWPDLGAEVLSKAVDLGRFENMREFEARNTFDNPRLAPPPDGDSDGFKTRRGKIGGYVDYLNRHDIDYLNRYIDDNLDDHFADYKSTAS